MPLSTTVENKMQMPFKNVSEVCDDPESIFEMHLQKEPHAQSTQGS